MKNIVIPSLLTTPIDGRVNYLRRLSVNAVLTHFVLNSRPLAGTKRIDDISITVGCTMKRPAVILHSISDYRERP
jgi:hypothetical protein